MARQEAQPVLTLPIWGKARLLRGRDDLGVRPQALALLYFLALEGPTTREKLVGLLWGRQGTAENLSVEFAYLRGLLERAGVSGLGRWEDPDELPPPSFPSWTCNPLKMRCRWMGWRMSLPAISRGWSGRGIS